MNKKINNTNNNSINNNNNLQKKYHYKNYYKKGNINDNRCQKFGKKIEITIGKIV
jgi:hypothetical protein